MGDLGSEREQCWLIAQITNFSGFLTPVSGELANSIISQWQRWQWPHSRVSKQEKSKNGIAFTGFFWGNTRLPLKCTTKQLNLMKRTGWVFCCFADYCTMQMVLHFSENSCGCIPGRNKLMLPAVWAEEELQGQEASPFSMGSWALRLCTLWFEGFSLQISTYTSHTLSWSTNRWSSNMFEPCYQY